MAFRKRTECKDPKRKARTMWSEGIGREKYAKRMWAENIEVV